MLNWDDFRFVLAVARSGSLSGAARAISVNHATVHRRISTLERRLGVRLFERFAQGYIPTIAGERLAAAGEKVEAELSDAAREVLGQDLRPEGTIRLATTQSLIETVLAPILAEFRASYPGVELEVVTSTEQASLARREADVALRPTSSPPEEAVARRISDLAAAVYANHAYKQDHDWNWRDERHIWVGPDESLTILRRTPVWRQLAEEGRLAYRANSVSGMHQAVRAGIGISVLPCFIGDEDHALVRLSEPLETMSTELWLLVHKDLRRVTRIRTFVDFIAAALRRKRGLFEGTIDMKHKDRKD